VKVHGGLTDYVASSEEAERVRRTLYRTDDSARATVLPAYRPGRRLRRLPGLGHGRGRVAGAPRAVTAAAGAAA
jgi:hypothetical protein